MRIRVLFFAAYRERVGSGELYVELPAGSTVSELLASLHRRGGPFSSLPVEPVVAVNRAFTGVGAELREGDEVALVPPVAGG